MFIVTCWAVLDEHWEERDQAILVAAGRRSDASGTAGCKAHHRREHAWYISNFANAVSLRQRLSKLDGVLQATLREK